MNRRGFLKITFSAGVAAAIPIAFDVIRTEDLPMIIGDGIHDDTAGLNAAIAGRPFIARDCCVTVARGFVHLAPISFRLSGTILIDGNNLVDFRD